MDTSDPLCSFYLGGAPKSLIDHLLLSQPCCGTITQAGVYTGSFFGSLSDHRPVVLGLTFWESAEPTHPTTHALLRPAVRGPELDLANPELVAAYQDHLITLLPPTTPRGLDASDALLQLSLASATWLATRLAQHRPPTRRRRHFDGWSPTAMALKANLSALLQIQSHLRGYRGHQRWRTQADMDRDLPDILHQWQHTVLRLRWKDGGDPHRIMDCTGMGPGGWRLATLHSVHHPHYCSTLITRVKRLLHGRQRRLLRIEISHHAARLEALRAQGRIGRVIKSTLQEEAELFTLESLCIPGEGILTDHRSIHNLVTDHFARWYRSPPGIDDSWTATPDHTSFLLHTARLAIPPDIGTLLWRALAGPPGVDAVRAELQGELAAPPTLDEFISTIEGHRGSTTPGATGLTYHMVKGWPGPIRVFAHHCLVELWALPDTPLWLQWGWLCPKPKDPAAEVTLDGLRPLILLEVLRKLWVGIVIQRITRAWERHHVLTDAQHGFRPGRGTDTALLQFINAREHADESGTQLYTSSWDIRRAFDSVSRGAMELSWCRLGVPKAVAHWLATMDIGGPTTIRSPWALTVWNTTQASGFGASPNLDTPCTFHRDRGTPQGDVSSPHNWVGFFDIALYALHLDRADPSSPAYGEEFMAPGALGTPYAVGDMGYADDLVSTSRSLHGLQRQADIISAFALCFHMEISVSKLRLAVFGRRTRHSPPTEALTIYGEHWSPQHVSVKDDGTIKMLGMTFDIHGPQHTQAAATTLRIGRASAIMGAQRAVDNAVLTATVSSLTRASYTAQFTAWSAAALPGLDTKFNQLYRRLSGNMPTFPTRLLYLPTSSGGMGLPRLSTYVNMRKWSMAQRALTHERPTNTAHAVAGLLDRAARLSGCPTDTGGPASIGYTSSTPSWGASLGHYIGGTTPIGIQKGTYQSILECPLAMLFAGSQRGRMLQLFTDRGLISWGDLTYCSGGAIRRWLPPALIEQLLPVASDTPGDCPPHSHIGRNTSVPA